MSEAKRVSSGGWFPEILSFVFIILKVAKVIDWSWWWVLSPVIVQLGLTLTILTVIGLIAVLIEANRRSS